MASRLGRCSLPYREALGSHAVHCRHPLGALQRRTSTHQLQLSSRACQLKPALVLNTLLSALRVFCLAAGPTRLWTGLGHPHPSKAQRHLPHQGRGHRCHVLQTSLGCCPCTSGGFYEGCCHLVNDLPDLKQERRTMNSLIARAMQRTNQLSTERFTSHRAPAHFQQCTGCVQGGMRLSKVVGTC